jgi:hypothetical protein
MVYYNATRALCFAVALSLKMKMPQSDLAKVPPNTQNSGLGAARARACAVQSGRVTPLPRLR